MISERQELHADATYPIAATVGNVVVGCHRVGETIDVDSIIAAALEERHLVWSRIRADLQLVGICLASWLNRRIMNDMRNGT